MQLPKKTVGASHKMMSPVLPGKARPAPAAFARPSYSTIAQQKPLPKAPPVFRLRPTPNAAQAKLANLASRQRRSPLAPPVFNPPLIQRTIALVNNSVRLPKTPQAPAVYRPQPPSAPLQAKPTTSQRDTGQVRVSAPMRAGKGSYRITAGAGGQQVGSVMVHERDRSSIEVTDLGVNSAHRKQGLGNALIASALRAGLQMGKTRVVLNSQDNGSGRLTNWYQGMGFVRTGGSRRGYPQLEASISRVLPRLAQRKSVPSPVKQIAGKSAAPGLSAASTLQREQSPLPGKSLQLKSGSRSSVSQPSQTSALLLTQANRTPRFALQPSAVVQRKPSAVIQRMHFDPSSHYSGHWPPGNNPPSTPPTPSGQYYEYGAYYHEDNQNLQGFDDYMDKYEDYSGTTVGQTVGSGESDDFDASYIDIPENCRPSAPASLWKQVYSGLTKSNKSPGFEYVRCEELCGKWLWVDAKTKCEYGTNKKPPMCHIVPYNHLVYAVEWIYANKGTLATQKYGAHTYKGPNAKGLDSDTWKHLVWEPSNLRPGHAKCNSKTASQAKGNPTGSDEVAAITYAVKRLKALKSNWF